MSPTESTLQIGQYNRLQVLKSSPYGLFLDGYDHSEILLPKRYTTEQMQPGGWVRVFVYADSSDRLVATTETPKATVGNVACLRAVEVNSIGAFMDWGLGKDLFVPFAEQSQRMRQGQDYCVYLYLDKHKDRILASSKLSRFIPEQWAGAKKGQQVDLLVCSQSKMGYKCLADSKYLALLHKAEVYKPLAIGSKLTGYIKEIRSDGRIDLTMTPKQSQKPEALQEEILTYLKESGGKAMIGDKSDPEEIHALFQCSKKNFKRAISQLYKNRKVIIRNNNLCLPEHKAD